MKPIRVGIVGMGRAGWKMHCTELDSHKDMFRVVAVCDLIPERLKPAREKYNAATYTDVRALAADPNVDLVDIASRSTEHVEHARIALAAGKFVFLEKPIAVSFAETQTLVKLDKKYPGKLFIRHNRRFEPSFQHVREIIDSGLLGPVHSITLRRGSYQRRDDWQTIRKCGGGQLLNWGPHIVDHALRFLKTPPVSISSQLQRISAAGDAEDLVRILLRNKDGMIVDLEISGTRILPEEEIRVCGQRGALTCTGDKIHIRHWKKGFRAKPRKADPGTPALDTFGSQDHIEWVETDLAVAPKLQSDMTRIWWHLYRTIRLGRPFPIRMEEAVEVMRVISLARKGTPFAE